MVLWKEPDARMAKPHIQILLKTIIFPLTSYGLEYIFIALMYSFFLWSPTVFFVISVLEQFVGWTQRKIACMVWIHCNLQPERSLFSLEKLILVGSFTTFVSYGSVKIMP
jgi:hypothetical protein